MNLNTGAWIVEVLRLIDEKKTVKRFCYAVLFSGLFIASLWPLGDLLNGVAALIEALR